MTWILLVMLGMIAGSIMVEFILPQKTKDLLGTVICSIMMFVTMAFLALSAGGLVWVTATRFVIPLFA